MDDFTVLQMALLVVGLIAAAISAGMLAGLLGVGGGIVDDDHFHVIGVRPVPSRAWVLGCVFDQALGGWDNDRCTMWRAGSKVYKG